MRGFLIIRWSISGYESSSCTCLMDRLSGFRPRNAPVSVMRQDEISLGVRRCREPNPTTGWGATTDLEIGREASEGSRTTLDKSK